MGMTSEEFERQKADTSRRFYIDHHPTADFGYVVIDRTTGTIIGSDVAEPEDQLLVRDYQWVAASLNRVANEQSARIAALEKLVREAMPMMALESGRWLSAAREAVGEVSR